MQQKPDVTPRTPNGIPADIIAVPSIAKTKGMAPAHLGTAHMRMDPRVLERIHNVVSVLERDYTDVIAHQTETLKRASANLSDDPTSATKQIYDIAHDIRGIGGTFARPLAGQIAAHICETLDDPIRKGPLNANTLQAKVDVLVQIANLSPEPEGLFASVVLERLNETANNEKPAPTNLPAKMAR